MTERRKNVDTVRFLMQNAAKFPLLTGEQEIQLSRQVQTMMRMEKKPEDERPSDWKIIVNQGQRAKNRMIESNLRLVINIAKKYQNMGLPFEDLIQEGTIGLSRGVELFDPERGYKASTYLCAWIKQSISVALGNKSKMIRLPMHMNERIQRLKWITREMTQATGNRPSGETLREAMELNENQWKITLSSLKDAISYDVKISKDENETCLIDLLASDLETPQANLDATGERDRAEQILKSINEREAYVLGLRYGLDKGEGRTLAEVGLIMGISRERVRQIEKKAMKSARKVAAQTPMVV